MRNYWIRLLIKVVSVFLAIVALMYLFEQQYPGKIQWTRLFELINSLIAAWGNILIALGILAYIGYWRDRMTKKAEEQMKELQKQGKEIKEAVMVTIQKTNHLLDTVGNSVEEIHRFINSGEWKEKAKAVLSYLEEQLQLMAIDIDSLRNSIKKEEIIEVSEDLEGKIRHLTEQDSLEMEQVTALVKTAPTLNEEKREQVLRILQWVDSRVEEQLQKFQKTLDDKLAKILGFSSDSPHLQEIKKVLRLEKLYVRIKVWLLLAIVHKGSTESISSYFHEYLRQLNLPELIMEVGKKYLSQLGFPWLESVLTKKLPPPREEKQA